MLPNQPRIQCAMIKVGLSFFTSFNFQTMDSHTGIGCCLSTLNAWSHLNGTMKPQTKVVFLGGGWDSWPRSWNLWGCRVMVWTQVCLAPEPGSLPLHYAAPKQWSQPLDSRPRRLSRQGVWKSICAFSIDQIYTNIAHFQRHVVLMCLIKDRLTHINVDLNYLF